MTNSTTNEISTLRFMSTVFTANELDVEKKENELEIIIVNIQLTARIVGIIT